MKFFSPISFCLFTVYFTSLSAVSFAQKTLFDLTNPKETSLNFVNKISDNEDLNVMAYEYFYNGGGVAVGDINNDGLEDVFLTANMSENKLFLNLGNLKFKDITHPAGKGLAGRKDGWKTGVTMADVNGDGLLDIYVCYSGKVDEDKRKNELFINKGNKNGIPVFEERAEEFGLAIPSYSTQAAFFDYDNDGDLDMMLLNHSVKKIDNMQLSKFKQQTDPLAGNKLFENKNNHFEDVSESAGINQFPLTFGLGIAISDINKDGWLDIYVTNDYNEQDYLYLNQGDGTFKEVSKAYFRHMAQFSMGVDIADFNNDGLPDLMSLDMLPEDNRRQKLLQLQENYEAFDLMQKQDLHKQYMRNMLQLNNGNGTFSEIGQLAGVSNTDWSWSPLFADFDNDGFKDLFVSNGYFRDYTNKDFLRYWGDYKIKKAVSREKVKLMDLVNAMPSTKLANYIFKNNGDFTFTNMQETWGLPQGSISAGAVYADLDNDGDLDLLISNINENVSLYKNNSNEIGKKAFIQIKLKQSTGNLNAVGAKVTVHTGDQIQYQEAIPSRGYLSCVSQKMNFGLGQNIQILDSITVIWPDRSVQILKKVAVNQILEINKMEEIATPKMRDDAVKNTPVFSEIAPLIAFEHQGFDENDFKRQPLMLSMYSQTGPVIAQGDVNNDGLEDIFISGDQEHKARIWLQNKRGSFEEMAGFAIGDEDISAISAALFFDANGDGNIDLYVAKGGYSLFEPNTISLQDELYLNNGKGKLELSVLSLPNMKASSKACVRAADYDNDGDLDLFVGGRIIPGRYPENPKSYLLNNDGAGNFKVVSTPFSEVGMITDVRWADMDHDGRQDLVLCGEYMPIKIYVNLATGFVDKTSSYFPKEIPGLWSALMVEDVNKDGELDIIVGNFGLNSQIKVSEKEPAALYYSDFDENGSIDPFFCFYIQGKSYPFVSRDELNDQIFPMRKKFAFYKDYAEATITDIFSSEELAKFKLKSVHEMRSMVLLNHQGTMKAWALPIEAQFAPVTAMVYQDFDGDGQADLFLAGNKTDNRLKLGSMDANYGCFLKGDGKGKFYYINQIQSGLSIMGDVKSVVTIEAGISQIMVIGAFNEPIQFYQSNP